MAKLTKVVRQGDDTQIIEMLSKIYAVCVNNKVQITLTSRILTQHEASCQADALHVFAVNLQILRIYD